MLASTSVIPVSLITPATPTLTAPLPAVQEAASVSLIEDVIEKITPPMEFRAWMEKLKTYAEAARSTEPAEPQPVAQAQGAEQAPFEEEAIPKAAPVERSGPDADAAADIPQRASDKAGSSA
mgnify:FL=1